MNQSAGQVDGSALGEPQNFASDVTHRRWENGFPGRESGAQKHSNLEVHGVVLERSAVGRSGWNAGFLQGRSGKVCSSFVLEEMRIHRRFCEGE